MCYLREVVFPRDEVKHREGITIVDRRAVSIISQESKWFVFPLKTDLY